jgi:hypothetical protein
MGDFSVPGGSILKKEVYITDDDLASNNASPNVNRKMALKMCFHGCMRIIE